MPDVLENIEALTDAPNVETLWQSYIRIVADYGFPKLFYGFTRFRTETSLGDPQDWVVLSNQSPAYLKVFIDEGQYFNAPMLKWARANEGVCSWRWVEEMARSGNLSDAELKLVEFNRKMGVSAGYTISFKSSTARTKGAVALSGDANMTQDDVEVIWAEHGRALTTISTVMHLKLLTLPYTLKRPLTKRQREVLEWVGDGKTTQDIATIMGLTSATVEKHLRLARESLDVDTTAQAVLKASFYNQMFIVDA